MINLDGRIKQTKQTNTFRAQTWSSAYLPLEEPVEGRRFEVVRQQLLSVAADVAVGVLGHTADKLLQRSLSLAKATKTASEATATPNRTGCHPGTLKQLHISPRHNTAKQVWEWVAYSIIL